jgi:hypothetical protein
MDEETVKSLSDREMDLEVAERLLGYRWYERDNTGRMVQVPFMTLALSPDRIAAVGPFKLHERSVEEEDRQRAMNRPEVPRFTANWQDVFREVVPAGPRRLRRGHSPGVVGSYAETDLRGGTIGLG